MKIIHTLLGRLGLQRAAPPNVELHAAFITADPDATFEQGMTLAPGQSADLKMELPPEISAAARRGASIECQQGTIRQLSHDSYEREVVLLVDQVPTAVCKIRWKSGAGGTA